MFTPFRCMRQMLMTAAALLVAAPLAAAALANDLDARIDRGLALLYQAQYETALDTFRSFCAGHPRHPAGYFFSAGAYQLRALAYESDDWEKQYAACLDSALALSDMAIRLDRKDPWAYFFRGGTYAYLASRDARNGSLLAALGKGLSGMSDLKKAVALDPTLYDAYLGLGSYHYFRTKAASIFKWLPFIGDRRGQGVEELRLAIARGRYGTVMAQNALLWVLIDYGKYGQALEAAQQLEKAHPGNHAFHWGAPEIFYRTGQWAKAAEAYARLLQLIEDAKPMNNYNRAFVKARLAKCLYEDRRYPEAHTAAREAIALPLNESGARRLRKERAGAMQVMKLSEKNLKGR
ncbi:MAG: hypothetical protein QME74_02800 [Candidatus Edwardsbacteria bacterium]|nr:hypothetical protein [Candidatus Edwardsbacteria bacterium]